MTARTRHFFLFLALATSGCDNGSSLGPIPSGAGGGGSTPTGTGGSGATPTGTGGSATPMGTGGSGTTPTSTGGSGTTPTNTGGAAPTSTGGAVSTGGSGAMPTSTGGGGGAPTGTGGTGATPSGSFELLFRDDFSDLDLNRWQLMTHSWDTNLALFSSEAAKVEAGNLVIRLLPAPTGTVDGTGAAKKFLGAEVRSKDTLTYGRVRARAKLATGSAVVSSLVTIYTPWPADNWNELDIECLGNDPTHVQFNAMVYTGAPVAKPATTSVSPTQDPLKVDLGFDPSADYHTYTIEWTPAGAVFLVDDVERRVWTKNIALMTLPQNVLLTIWASSSAGWAGPVTEATALASAQYDWIELYNYRMP